MAASQGSRDALPREVARRVEGWIHAKRYTKGDQLPGEREMALRLSTSRNAVREALKILETRGMVEIRRGVGTFVLENETQNLTVPVRLRVATERLPVEEVFIARRTIECAVVDVAARSRDQLDLQMLRELLESARNASEAGDVEQFVTSDLAFHDYLGKCTHNALLSDIQSEMTRATAGIRDVASATHEAMHAAIRFHEEIIDSMARGDGEGARAAMLLHLIDAVERSLGALADASDQREGC